MRIEDCGAGLFKWVIVIQYMVGVADMESAYIGN